MNGSEQRLTNNMGRAKPPIVIHSYGDSPWTAPYFVVRQDRHQPNPLAGHIDPRERFGV